MKRILSFALILIMAVSITACKAGNSPAVSQDPTETPATPTEVTPDPTEVIPTDDPVEPTETPEPDATPMPYRPEDPYPELSKIIQSRDVFFIVYPDGTLYGWGKNDHGQLGLGTTEDKAMPVFIANGLTPVVVGETVFALSSDNILWGWGRNDMGQLGTGDTEDALRPLELMHFVKDVISYWDGIYALTESGELYKWGLNRDGEGSLEPELLFENVDYFSGHCMIKDGDLWIKRGDWMKLAEGAVRVFDKGGYISYVECTDGILYYINDYNELGPICGDIHDVKVSDRCAYILKNDGTLWCWDMEGEYHDAPEEQQEVLTFIMDGVIEIQCDWEMGEDWGYNYNFALKANGELWAWSMGYSNALVGKARDNECLDPECVATGVKYLFTNNAQSYIITDGGEVWATGLSSDDGIVHGGLGDGTDITRFGFVSIGLKGICGIFTNLGEVYGEDEDSDWVELYARTFAVDAEGRIYAWGWNGDGLLGVNSTDEVVLSPTEVYLTK